MKSLTFLATVLTIGFSISNANANCTLTCKNCNVKQSEALEKAMTGAVSDAQLKDGKFWLGRDNGRTTGAYTFAIESEAVRHTRYMGGLDLLPVRISGNTIHTRFVVKDPYGNSVFSTTVEKKWKPNGIQVQRRVNAEAEQAARQKIADGYRNAAAKFSKDCKWFWDGPGYR